MKNILLVILVFSYCFVNAQLNNTVSAEIDSYSGEKTFGTGTINFSGGYYSLYKNNNIISLHIVFYSNTCFVIPAGEYFYIKFSDNSVLKLRLDSRSLPDVSGGVFQNWMYFYLNTQQLNILKQKQIIGVKCYIDSHPFSSSDGILFQSNINYLSKTSFNTQLRKQKDEKLLELKNEKIKDSLLVRLRNGLITRKDYYNKQVEFNIISQQDADWLLSNEEKEEKLRIETEERDRKLREFRDKTVLDVKTILYSDSVENIFYKNREIQLRTNTVPY